MAQLTAAFGGLALAFEEALGSGEEPAALLRRALREFGLLWRVADRVNRLYSNYTLLIIASNAVSLVTLTYVSIVDKEVPLFRLFEMKEGGSKERKAEGDRSMKSPRLIQIQAPRGEGFESSGFTRVQTAFWLVFYVQQLWSLSLAAELHRKASPALAEVLCYHYEV